MRLTAKLVAAIVVGIAVMLGIETAFALNRAAAMYEADMKRDTDLIGRLMRTLLVDEWRMNGLDHALQAISASNRQEQLVHFRWIWLSEHAVDPFRAQVTFEELAPALHGETVSIRSSGRDGRFQFTYVPLQIGTGDPAALEIAESLAPLDAYALGIERRTVVLAVGLGLLGGAVTIFLGFGMVGRPLQRVTDKVRRVGAGDLGGPLRLKGRDELSELTASINAMCDGLAAANANAQAQTEARVRTLEQLRHADRLSTVGMLAAGLGHELGSPLIVMSGRADMIAKGDLSQEGTRENAVIIKAQAERVTQIVRQLLAFARRETPSKTSVNVVGLINDTVHLLSSLASKQRAEIRVCDQPPLPAISADPGQLQQVFANLLINAIQAMPRGGEVVFTVQSQTARALHAAADECYVRVDVQDQGPGIPAEHMGRIFDPFFTTKDIGEGTGLGLSIAYGIVQEHGGWIEVNSAPGRGACFSVFLPLEEAPCPDAS